MNAGKSKARAKQIGYRLASRLPKLVWWPLGRLISLVLSYFPPAGVRQWATNIKLATGNDPTRSLTRQAIWSWWLNTVMSLRLGTFTAEEIQEMVLVNEDRFATLLDLHHSTGLVLALPHMGSWDLAGAFACARGLPVTTVAERLPGGAFEYFRDLRTRLGFEVYPYDEPDLIQRLSGDLARGRTIALVADRDFSNRGVPVTWPNQAGGRPARLPVGPIAIAQRTGAAVVPVWCGFLARSPGRTGLALGSRRAIMEIIIGDPISIAPGREAIVSASQDLAQFFAKAVTTAPAEWHMMQRFFPTQVPQ